MERREIEGQRGPKIAIAVAIFFLSFTITESGAQTLPEGIVSVIEQVAESGDESSIEEYLSYYVTLLRHPLEINIASRSDLERLGVLSLFQIESIIEYRKEYGEVLSAQELALVNGMNPAIVEQLRPFLSFVSKNAIGAPYDNAASNDIMLRLKKKWKENGIQSAAKYKFSYLDRYEAGITLESDAGEKLSKCYHPDFTSFFAQYKGEKVLRNVVVGDYAARFGQGLVMWKSFPMSVFGAPAAVVKRESGITPYTSTSEDNYLRGAGVTLSFKQLETSFFASVNAIDARVVGDTAYTSIVTGGRHVTEAEIAKRKSMMEYLFGSNISYRFKRWKVGLTAVGYTYNKKNMRRVEEYNRYQMYDGLWGNVGIDLFGYYRNFRFFAEVAIDMTPSFAALAGAIWSPFYELEMSLLARSYSKGYIATHSGAYSTASATANQQGGIFSLRYYLPKQWSIISNIEYTYFPGERFRIAKGSSKLKARFALQKEFNSGTSFLLQGNCNYAIGEAPIIKGRLNGHIAVSPNWSLGTRVEGNLQGFAVFQETTYKSSRTNWECSLRVTYYNTEDWDSRVYLYEKGMPESFSVEPYFGKGIAIYGVIRYSPFRNLDIFLKCSRSYSAFLIRMTIPG